MKPNIAKAIAGMGQEPLNPIGTCFDSAAHQMVHGEEPPPSLRMCHGIAVANMPGQEGLTIGHACVECFDDTKGVVVAIDTTWGVVQSAAKYRADLKLSHVTEYDRETFIRMWTANGYPGPWDNNIKLITDKKDRRNG